MVFVGERGWDGSAGGLIMGGERKQKFSSNDVLPLQEFLKIIDGSQCSG